MIGRMLLCHLAIVALPIDYVDVVRAEEGGVPMIVVFQQHATFDNFRGVYQADERERQHPGRWRYLSHCGAATADARIIYHYRGCSSDGRPDVGSSASDYPVSRPRTLTHGGLALPHSPTSPARHHPVRHIHRHIPTPIRPPSDNPPTRLLRPLRADQPALAMAPLPLPAS